MVNLCCSALITTFLLQATHIYKEARFFASMVATTLTELAQQQGMPIALLIFIIVWSLAWKGIAWWRSARNNHLVWFILFFFIHTLGILEILYIFLFSRKEFLASFRSSGSQKRTARIRPTRIASAKKVSLSRRR